MITPHLSRCIIYGNTDLYVYLIGLSTSVDITRIFTPFWRYAQTNTLYDNTWNSGRIVSSWSITDSRFARGENQGTLIEKALLNAAYFHITDCYMIICYSIIICLVALKSWSLDVSKNVQNVKVFAIFECVVINYILFSKNA